MRAVMLFAPFTIVAVSLSGCASVPSDPPTWVRTDGQVMKGNAALEQQLQIDGTICLGQVQQTAAGAEPIYAGGIVGGIMRAERDGAMVDAAKGCMAQKGYVNVPLSKAAQTQAAFAQTSSARKALKPNS